MCGIIIKSGDTASLKILYEKQKARGSDGAGIFWLRSSNILAFKTSDIDAFFDELDKGSYAEFVTPKWNNLTDEEKKTADQKYLLKDINTPYVFHHRKKSMGSIVTDLNHPFLFERGNISYIGIHNGTSRDSIDFYKHTSKIWKIKEMPELVKDKFNDIVEIDSQYILGYIIYLREFFKDNDEAFFNMTQAFLNEFTIGVVVFAEYDNKNTIFEKLYIMKSKDRELHIDKQNKIVTSEILTPGVYDECMEGFIVLDKDLNILSENMKYEKHVEIKDEKELEEYKKALPARTGYYAQV